MNIKKGEMKMEMESPKGKIETGMGTGRGTREGTAMMGLMEGVSDSQAKAG